MKVVWSNCGITADATHWLADRSFKQHGVEGPSTDKPSDSLFPNHRVFRDRKSTHYEWLINLEEMIGKGEFQFFGPPLKISDGSGSPVRAWAMVDDLRKPPTGTGVNTCHGSIRGRTISAFRSLY